MMFEAETTWLLEMRLRARGHPVLLAQLDRALWLVSQLATEDADLDGLEGEVEELAALVGLKAAVH